jgi:hypothetical protein
MNLMAVNEKFVNNVNNRSHSHDKSINNDHSNSNRNY